MRDIGKPPPGLILTPRPYRGKISTKWSRSRAGVKKFVEWALKNQEGQCVFCGFFVGDVRYRRAYDVDHFAPQANTLYPQWKFEPLNLVIACHSCNSVLKQGYDSVITVSSNYANCSFSLVHPYLDSVNDHLQGTYSGGAQQIGAPSFCTLKGLRTIRKFKLDDPDYISEINNQAESLALAAWKNAAPDADVKRYKKALSEIEGNRRSGQIN